MGEPLALQYAPEAMRRDRSIVLDAVTSRVGAMEFADNDLKCDRSFALLAIQRHASVIQYLTNMFSDVDFLLKVVEDFQATWEHIPESVLCSHGFMLRAISSDSNAVRQAALRRLPSCLRMDAGFMGSAVRIDGLFLEHAAFELRNDRDIVRAAVRQNASALKYASKERCSDRLVVLEAYARDPLT